MNILQALQLEGCESQENRQYNYFDFPCGLSISIELTKEETYDAWASLAREAHRRHHYEGHHDKRYWALVGYATAEGKPLMVVCPRHQ